MHTMNKFCQRKQCSSNPLSSEPVDVSSRCMKDKWTKVLPLMLVTAFALTRWPGLLPFNFSAAYALAFCAGVYFPGPLAWWWPLGALAVSDLALNFYYSFVLHIEAFKATQLVNYLAYALIIGLG